jgi:hypothetical protein
MKSQIPSIYDFTSRGLGSQQITEKHVISHLAYEQEWHQNMRALPHITSTLNCLSNMRINGVTQNISSRHDTAYLTLEVRRRNYENTVSYPIHIELSLGHEGQRIHPKYTSARHDVSHTWLSNKHVTRSPELWEQRLIAHPRWAVFRTRTPTDTTQNTRLVSTSWTWISHTNNVLENMNPTLTAKPMICNIKIYSYNFRSTLNSLSIQNYNLMNATNRK